MSIGMRYSDAYVCECLIIYAEWMIGYNHQEWGQINMLIIDAFHTLHLLSIRTKPSFMFQFVPCKAFLRSSVLSYLKIHELVCREGGGGSFRNK